MSGGKAPKSTTQVNKTELSAEQKKLYELAFPYAQDYAANPAQAYQGQTIADFTPNEVAGQQGAIAAATGAGQGVANSTADATNRILSADFLSPDTNPWLAKSGDAIVKKTTDNLNENILPAIRGQSTIQGGLYSGGNTRGYITEGLAAGKTQDANAMALSSLYSDAFKTGLGAQTDALRTAPLTQASQLFGSQVQSQVGAQERSMQQAKLDEAAAKFNLEQQLPFLTAQDLLSLVSAQPGGQGVSTVTGAQPKTNRAVGVLGGAASGAALGSVVPGVGTAVGAGAGALLALLGGM